MNLYVWFWLAALVAFLVVEAQTFALTSVWFALGALAAALCALLKGPFWLQLLWFLGVSVLALCATRTFVKKYVNPRRQPTNADRSIGRCGVVTVTVDNLRSSGEVKLDGRIWSARSLSGEPIEEGSVVIVREIRGVKLFVEQVRETEVSAKN
ncbi:MAG: NfeD family protein [Clostridiales bacterium]|nr:NfeD family protein [Candidatus Apopatocola equi]MCQ2439326.1 NfeD family protein [Oscillospiraceae bacterium]